MQVVFYNKLLWFVSELPEKDISNVVAGPMQVVYNKLPWFVSELPEKDIWRTWWSSLGSILQ